MLRISQGSFHLYFRSRFFLLAKLCSSVPQAEASNDTAEKVELSGHAETSSIKSVASLLQSAYSKNSAHVFEALEMLADLKLREKFDFKKDIENTDRFRRFLNVLEKSAHGRNPSIVLSALKNLATLGVDSSSFLVQHLQTLLAMTIKRKWVIFLSYSLQSMENELLWNVRKVSIPLLMAVLVFQKDRQETDIQKKLMQETVAVIQRRWVEINTAKEISTVYIYNSVFSSDFIGRIDDRTIEIIEDMNVQDLAKIVCALGVAKRRATPVLRALAFHLSKKEEKLSPKHISNLLHAAQVLSFHDQALMEKIARDLLPQIPNIDKPTVVGSILTRIGQMTWRHSSLLEALSEWVEKNVNICRTNDLVSLFMTLASVNYTPNNINALIKVIFPLLTRETVNCDTAWLDYVWSLVVLCLGTSEHISSVLHTDFLAKLSSMHEYVSAGFQLKLLNINAAARLLYSGSVLPSSNANGIIYTQSRNKVILTKHVHSILLNFIPRPQYIFENIETNLGVFVEAEFAVDRNCSPVPVINYSSPLVSSSAKHLPNGCSRVALFVWDYKDFTIGQRELIGRCQLAVKLVKASGYKVIQVPFYEYSMKEKTLKNVQMLQSKIKEACLEEL